MWCCVSITVSEFIKTRNLKIGDILTNGKENWIISKDTVNESEFEFYLKNTSRHSGHISAILLDQVSIPDLEHTKPFIKVYKYIIQLAEDSDYRVTTEWWANESAARIHYSNLGLHVVNSCIIPFTEKEVEAEPNKLRYFG